MASSDKNQDMSRVISDLSKTIHQLNDSLNGSRSTSTAGGRSASGNAQKAASKELKDLTKTIADADKELDKLRKGIKDSEHSFDSLYSAQTALTRGLVSNAKLNDKAQSKLIERIDKNIRSYSILGESMENASKKASFLEDKLEKTGKFLADYNSVLKDAKAQNLNSISDFETLRKALDRLNKETELSADVQKMIKDGEFKRAAQSIDNESHNATVIRNSIKKTSVGFIQLTNISNNLKTGMSKAADAIGAGFVKDAATLGGSLGLITSGVKQVYSQFWQTASAGFGGAFLRLSTTAIGLGISLESLTKITRENIQQVGKMGLKGFTDSLKDTQVQLMTLGLTTEEAARAKAAFNQNAFLTGTDLKNRVEVNNATQDQIAAFENLRAVTGESFEALAAQTKSLITNNDATKIMGSLNRQQRVQMLQDINLERVRLTTMGLTNEAAGGVVKALQSIQNSKVTDRLEAGNKIMAAGSALGLDPTQTAQVAQILQKGRNKWTGEDKKFIADFSQQVAAKQDNVAGGDINDQLLGSWTEELTTSLAPAVDNMREANLGRGLTPDEVNANKELGKVNPTIAQASQKIEVAIQALNSPLSRIAAGLIGIAALLAKNLLRKPSALDDFAMPKAAGPGSSVQGKSSASRQAEAAAMSSFAGEPKKGFSGMDELAKKIQSDKAYAKSQANGSGRTAANSTSLSSPDLQARLAKNAKEHVPTEFPKPAASPVGKIGGGLGGTLGKIGTKAIPIIGWAITAMGAISGAFDGLADAANIFGVDTDKQALTTSQKISAGVAGALNSLSFGLIPTDSAAKFLNDIGENGIDGLLDSLKTGYETLFNKIIPAVYGAVKSVFGWITDGISGAITSVFNIDAWKNLLAGGDGGGGIVQKILSTMWEGFKFFGSALIKGVVKITDDLVSGMLGRLPFVGKSAAAAYESLKKATGADAAVSWAGEDNKFDRNDNQQKIHDKRAADAKSDANKAKVQGSASGGSAASNGDNLGLVNAFGATLTPDQLAAQGIQASPSSTSSPGVSTANGGSAAASGNVTNNTTNNTTNTAPKTAAEQILTDISTKISTLVDLTNQGLKLAQEDFKLSTTASRVGAGRGGAGGYSPSLETFLNTPL